MIALDSSVVIQFFTDRDARVRKILLEGQVALPPAVIAELYSDPKARRDMTAFVEAAFVMPITDGYWQRAGVLRGKIRATGLRANLGDALIAQSCIDHGVPLLTYDTDFRHYAAMGGLVLAAKIG
jgi:predicted nucleic acid-binding protein